MGDSKSIIKLPSLLTLAGVLFSLNVQAWWANDLVDPTDDKSGGSISGACNYAELISLGAMTKYDQDFDSSLGYAESKGLYPFFEAAIDENDMDIPEKYREAVFTYVFTHAAIPTKWDILSWKMKDREDREGYLAGQMVLDWVVNQFLGCETQKETLADPNTNKDSDEQE